MNDTPTRPIIILLIIIVGALLAAILGISLVMVARILNPDDYPSDTTIEILPEISDPEPIDCNSICQESCSDFNPDNQLQECLTECASYCAHDY